MQKLSLPTIIGYSFGDVANNFAFAMGALFLLSYYTDVAGIEAAVAGAILLGVRVFDAFADVFAGRVVDSVNTRFGKFRPFLLFASVPLMAMSVLVFCIPSDWGHDAKVVFATVTYALLGLCYSFVNIPYGSLATAMTQDPLSRARLGAARTIGASCTFVLLAFVIAPQISGTDTQNIQNTYIQYTLGLAFIGLILYFLCFKATKENVVRTVAQPSMKVSLNTVKQNRPLIMLCLAALFLLAGNFALSASGIYYVRYMLNDPSLFTVLILVQMVVGSILPAPFIPRMVAKFGKKKTFLIGNVVGVIGFALFFFLSPYFYPAMIALSIASMGVGFSMTVMWALEADTVEYGEYKTGVRIEGLTYSLFSLTRKCGQAVGGSIPAFILSMSGYVANQVQSEEVLLGIRTAIAIVPSVCLAAAFLIMAFYPLTDKVFASIIKEIAKKRELAKTNNEALDQYKAQAQAQPKAQATAIAQATAPVNSQENDVAAAKEAAPSSNQVQKQIATS